MVLFSKLFVIGAAALATVSGTQAYSLNSENRVLLRLTNPARDAQATNDIVGDTITETFDNYVVWSRPQDIPKLDDLGIEYEEVDYDYVGLLEELRAVGAAPRADGSIFAPISDERVQAASQMGAGFEDDDWYALYHRYPDMIKKAKGYIFHAPPELDAEWFDELGQTFEGRDMKAAAFGGRKTGYKYWFHIQANIHAREWIAGHSTLFAVREMLRLYQDGDEEMRYILDNIRINYVPIQNPDGYEYTWTVDRYWRKNRRVNEDILGTGIAAPAPGLRVICPLGSEGVDMNRGYSDHHVVVEDQCSDIYGGPFPFSEPATLATLRHIQRLKDEGADFLVGWDCHTFAALLLRPIGHANIPNEFCPENQAWVNRISHFMREAMIARDGYDWTESWTISGGTSNGIARDWLYSNLTSNRLGMTIELRPNNADLFAAGLLTGFSPPPSYIIPTGLDLVEGFRVAGSDAADVATGKIPRDIPDTVYDFYYDPDEIFVGDEPNPVFRCFESLDENPNEEFAAKSTTATSSTSVPVGLVGAGAAVAAAGVAGAAVYLYKRNQAKEAFADALEHASASA